MMNLNKKNQSEENKNMDVILAKLDNMQYLERIF